MQAAEKGQTDSTRGKGGSSSSGSAGHAQEGSFQGPIEAAEAEASGSDDEGRQGQRRQPVSTREIAVSTTWRLLNTGLPRLCLHQAWHIAYHFSELMLRAHASCILTPGLHIYQE